MATYRLQKTHNFSVISNTILTDTRLSWEARGLAAYILTKPDGWVTRTAHLITQSPSGKDRVHKIMQELETLGYLVRKTSRNPDGTFLYFQDLFEEPQTESGGLARNGESGAGESGAGKARPLLNTDRQNTDRSNTDLNNTSRLRRKHPIPEFMTLTSEREKEMMALGCSNPVHVFADFKTYYMARRHIQLTDWDLELTRWTRNQFSKTPTPSSADPLPHMSAGVASLARRMKRALEEQDGKVRGIENSDDGQRSVVQTTNRRPDR